MRFSSSRTLCRACSSSPSGAKKFSSRSPSNSAQPSSDLSTRIASSRWKRSTTQQSKRPSRSRWLMVAVPRGRTPATRSSRGPVIMPIKRRSRPARQVLASKGGRPKTSSLNLPSTPQRMLVSRTQWRTCGSSLPRMPAFRRTEGISSRSMTSVAVSRASARTSTFKTPSESGCSSLFWRSAMR